MPVAASLKVVFISSVVLVVVVVVVVALVVDSVVAFTVSYTHLTLPTKA